MDKRLTQPNEPEIDAFHEADTEALVRMWRESFEFGVGVVDPHSVEEHIEYFRREVLPRHEVRVARTAAGLAGFIAFDAESVAQLYVHPREHGRGIGTRLLRLAQQGSSGRLWLYTFKRNTRAQRFYEGHGFRIVAAGFEPHWQLEDLRYEWVA